jgi:hypothetical protein
MEWERIWRLYWVEVQPLTKIAAGLGIAASTLRRHMLGWGFPIRSRGAVTSTRENKLTSEDLEALIGELKAGGSTMVELGETYGISKQRVHQIKKRYLP